MKRAIIMILVFLLIPLFATGEDAHNLMPRNDIWGISRDALREEVNADLEECEVGGKKALKAPSIIFNGYTMTPYYVFGVKTWDSTGYKFMGLSKIVYIVSDQSIESTSQLIECQQQMIDSMSQKLGSPHSQSDAVAKWKSDECFVEVGRGKFKNYTGSDKPTVAIVFSVLNIVNPVTPSPTPRPTPPPTPTPKPAEKSEKSSSGKLSAGACKNIGIAYIDSVYPGSRIIMDPTVDVDSKYGYVGASLESFNGGLRVIVVAVDRRTGRVAGVETIP